MTLRELVQQEAAAMRAALVNAHMADRTVPNNSVAQRLEAERLVIQWSARA